MKEKLQNMKGKLLNKKTLAIVAIVLAALALIAGAIALALSGGETQKACTGYLICQDCGLKGTCTLDKTDLAAHPEKHTLKCAKSSDCIVSGFGVAVQQENGTYRFQPFDAAGSSLALHDIIYQTKRADALLVEVKGKLEDGVLHVEAIAEK